jgi:hypothetical protein
VEGQENIPSTPEQLRLEILSPSGTQIPGKAFQIPVIGEDDAGAYFVQFRSSGTRGIFSLQVFSQFGVPLFEERPLAVTVPKQNQVCLVSLNLPLTAEDLDLEISPWKVDPEFFQNRGNAKGANESNATSTTSGKGSNETNEGKDTNGEKGTKKVRMTTSASGRFRKGGTIQTLPEGFVAIFFDDPVGGRRVEEGGEGKEGKEEGGERQGGIGEEGGKGEGKGRKGKEKEGGAEIPVVKIAEFQLFYNARSLFHENFDITL